MLEPDEIAAVVATGLPAGAFENITCRAAFDWIIEFWRQHSQPPTTAVMTYEFPVLKLDAEVDEPVDWLVSTLQQRYTVNQAQDVMIAAAQTLDADPEATIVGLRNALDDVLRQSGTTPGATLYTDVGAMLDDALPEAPRPEVLTRADEVPLFYRGEVNLLFGDPEHGKTWVGLAACAEALAAGGRVLVADIDHNGAQAIVSRLVLLGAPREALRDPDRFRHCEPAEVPAVVRMVADCASWTPDVAFVDSTGELLPMFGANSDSGDDFTRVHARVLQPLADLGAAVLLVDHLAKGRDSRALGPGGTMAKRRTVGGLSLRVVRERPFTRTGGGTARLMVNKDRHGGVRDHCAPPRPGKDNDEQLAGTFVFDANADGPTWLVAPPQRDTSGTDEGFRPTVLMERASRVIESHPGEFTRNKAAEQTGGKKETTLRAIDVLESEGHVTKSQDRYPVYASARPYRQAEDPRAESHMPLGSRLRRHQSHQEEQAGGQDDD